MRMFISAALVFVVGLRFEPKMRIPKGLRGRTKWEGKRRPLGCGSV